MYTLFCMTFKNQILALGIKYMPKYFTVNKIEKGGLNMIDLKSQISAMRASWASHIVTAPADSLWSYLPKSYLSIFGDDYLILKTTIVNKTMFPSLKQIPEFYQDVVLSYNKSKIMSHEDFHNNITNQPIWANRFIKLKKETLLFKTWVSDGIIAMKNLKIDNGKLDVDYLYSVVTEKRELYREVHILQNALKQAKVTLSIEPTRDTNIPIYFHHTDEIYTWGPHKSKFYYNKLIEEVVIPPTSETYWQRATNLRVAEDVIHKSYIQKVKQLKDKKLAETNFKILNNVLPCNKNLCKWGIGDTDLLLLLSRGGKYQPFTLPVPTCQRYMGGRECHNAWWTSNFTWYGHIWSRSKHCP